jgi:hypothetical protein
MTSDTLAALRQAAAAVRTQIPTGGLTVASVERLLPAAEAVCAAAAEPGSSRGKASNAAPRAGTGGKRQEARRRWAEIARRNAQETPRAPAKAG